MPVKVVLANHSSVPLWSSHVFAYYRFALAAGSSGPDGGVRRSECGRRTEVSAWISSRKLLAIHPPLLQPGKAQVWPRFLLGEFYDLTLPGRYRLRFIARRRFFRIKGAARIYRLTGFKHIDSMIYWPIAAGSMGHWVAKRLPVVRSNVLFITVAAPYGKLPRAALEPATNGPSIPVKPVGFQVEAREVSGGGAMPVLLRVQLFGGPTPLRLKLTGNPLEDFKETQVISPGFHGAPVAGSRPGRAPFVRRKTASLTAYGRWLVKHPIKGLEQATYTLKPGVVYKYAVPINLSCQFDMSMPGTYHVRVELAHPKVWSDWIKVKVP